MNCGKDSKLPSLGDTALPPPPFTSYDKEIYIGRDDVLNSGMTKLHWDKKVSTTLTDTFCTTEPNHDIKVGHNRGSPRQYLL